MKKVLLLFLMFFCISLTAMTKARSSSSAGIIHKNNLKISINHLIANHDEAYVNMLSPYENKFLACYEGEKQEKFTKLDDFMNKCFTNHVNPNLFIIDNKNALNLACEVDEEGILFKKLINYKIYLNSEQISQLIETALSSENHKVLEIMADKGIISPKDYLRLINFPALSRQKCFFLSCFEKYLDLHSQNSETENYLSIIKLIREGSENDSSCKESPEPKIEIDSKKTSKLVEIALSSQSYEATKIMAAKGMLSSKDLSRLIDHPELSKEKSFFLRCFTQHLDPNSKNTKSVNYLRPFLKLACELDQESEEFDKLIEGIAYNEKLIDELFEIACKHRNYAVIHSMLLRSFLNQAQISHYRFIVSQ